jgi:hypothetical protein
LGAAAIPARAVGGRGRREAGGDDRPGGGADEALGHAQVDVPGGLDPGEHAGHPRLAERAAGAEHQDVGLVGHQPHVKVRE